MVLITSVLTARQGGTFSLFYPAASSTLLVYRFLVLKATVNSTTPFCVPYFSSPFPTAEEASDELEPANDMFRKGKVVMRGLVAKYYRAV